MEDAIDRRKFLKIVGWSSLVLAAPLIIPPLAKHMPSIPYGEIERKIEKENKMIDEKVRAIERGSMENKTLDSMDLTLRDRAYLDIMDNSFPRAFETAKKVAEKERINPLLIYSMIYNEAHLKKYYENGIKESGKEIRFAPSSSGAAGLMGIKEKGAFAEVGRKMGYSFKDMESYEPNLIVGVTYLKKLNKKYKNLPLALWAYNMGPTRLDRLGVECNLFNKDKTEEFLNFEKKLKSDSKFGKKHKERSDYVKRTLLAARDFYDTLINCGRIRREDFVDPSILFTDRKFTEVNEYLKDRILYECAGLDHTRLVKPVNS